MAIVGAAFTALGMGLGMSSVSAALFASSASRTLIQLLGTVALGALSSALQGPKRSAGLRTSETLTGGTNPLSFIVGTYATAGSLACPSMSHGSVGGYQNAYATYVITLSDIPGVTLQGLILGGEEAVIGGTPHPDYGDQILGRFEDRAWIKFYDGSQVAADPMLLDKYSSYPERPWSADMLLTNVAYAIITLRYDPKVFSGPLEAKFVIGGIPLYDPRKDSTVGGSGSHVWGNASTYEYTGNPSVIAYNIFRGITIPGLDVWGGECTAEDLPLSSWFTAMNEADVDQTLSGGGTQKRYRCGYEIRVTDQPADVLDEILKSAAAKVADNGGVWKIRSGPASSSVMSFTDADLLIDQAQSMDPFLGLDQTYNAITATYPEPAALWEPKEAPPRFNATWEARDGGRRITAELSLPAVNSKQQVQRLMKAAIADHQRNVQAQIPFSRRFALLEPLDTVAWTSTRNGYTAKLFEIDEVSEDIMQGGPAVAMREVDPADFGWVVGDELPTSAPNAGAVPPTELATAIVPGFDADPVAMTDGNGARRQAIVIKWDAALIENATGIAWEVRLTDGVFEDGYVAPDGGNPSLVFDPASDVYASDVDGWGGGTPVPSLIFDPAFDRYGSNATWYEADATRIILKGNIAKKDIAAGIAYITDGILNNTAYSVRAELIADYPTEPTGWRAVTTGSVGMAQADFTGAGAIVARASMLPDSTTYVNFSGTILPATVTIGTEVNQAGISPAFPSPLKTFKYSISFRARKTGATDWTALYQERIMDNGVWGAWVTLQSWTISGGAYVFLDYAGAKNGGAEDYQYRLATTAANNQIDAFKTLYVTVVEDL